jgi:hypothetical protein
MGGLSNANAYNILVRKLQWKRRTWMNLKNRRMILPYISEKFYAWLHTGLIEFNGGGLLNTEISFQHIKTDADFLKSANLFTS